MMISKALREYKGKSIVQFPGSYTVIDIETTGLDYQNCEIIEISALKIIDGVEADSYSSLIQPTPYYYYDDDNNKQNIFIDDFITCLTGITNEMLEFAPKICDVLPSFKQFISDSILVGHNVNFDINFLYDAFVKNLEEPLKNDFIDTMRISRKLLPDLEHHRLRDISEYFGICYDGAHRAIKDCVITNECFVKLKNSIEEQCIDLDVFFKSFKRNLDAKSLSTNKTNFDISHPLYNKLCVFTGELSRFSRSQAMQIVLDLGGQCGNGVTQKTTYLILGNNEFCKTIKDGKSSKQKKAERYMLDGIDISIISEDVFCEMINIK